MLELKDKKILVVGLGKTGMSVASFAKSRLAVVTVTDIGSEAQLKDNARQLKALGVELELGFHAPETFIQADLIILSPGVPHTLEPIAMAQKKGVPVMGEIEFASRFIQKPIVAITGTNGKTTTTTILGDMLVRSGLSVFVGGNIGNPLIDFVAQKLDTDIVVIEISSFQLDTIDRFCPHIGAILNITDDHLDRYPDFNGYVQSKLSLFINQKDNDYAVLNANDPALAKAVTQIKSQKVFFNTQNDQQFGTQISANQVLFQLPDRKPQHMDFANIEHLTPHDRENVLAAALCTLLAGGNIDGIVSAINNFNGLSHRLELVNTVNNVYFYDDSKATNVDAVLRALESFDNSIVLIMGGRDKGGSYKALEHQIRQKVKKIILIGEAAETIRSELTHCVSTQKASSMEDAVRLAARNAEPGDIVLLSPACSSFDMFKSYAHRGDVFQKAVLELNRKSA